MSTSEINFLWGLNNNRHLFRKTVFVADATLLSIGLIFSKYYHHRS